MTNEAKITVLGGYCWRFRVLDLSASLVAAMSVPVLCLLVMLVLCCWLVCQPRGVFRPGVFLAGALDVEACPRAPVHGH